MRQDEGSSRRCTNVNGGCLGITSKHRGVTRIHRGITRMHRGITIIHSGPAGCRWRRIVNPIHAALEKGLGDITPSQDRTPSLVCQMIVETIGSLPKVPIRRQEPPECSSHGVAQTLMSSGCELASQGEAGGRIQSLRDGVNELLYSDKVLGLAIV